MPPGFATFPDSPQPPNPTSVPPYSPQPVPILPSTTEEEQTNVLSPLTPMDTFVPPSPSEGDVDPTIVQDLDAPNINTSEPNDTRPSSNPPTDQMDKSEVPGERERSNNEGNEIGVVGHIMIGVGGLAGCIILVALWYFKFRDPVRESLSSHGEDSHGWKSKSKVECISAWSEHGARKAGGSQTRRTPVPNKSVHPSPESYGFRLQSFCCPFASRDRVVEFGDKARIGDGSEQIECI